MSNIKTAIAVWVLSAVAAFAHSTTSLSSGSAVGGMIVVPAPFQVFQRSSGVADIPIEGFCQGQRVIEASWKGGAFVSIATNTSGYFRTSLKSQSSGWGTLVVRYKDAPQLSNSITVGIGDVFVISGQSNASGRGNNNQSYASPDGVLKTSEFANDYTWKDCTDPVDSAVRQNDTVSADTGGTAAAGSCWPLLASYIMTNQTVPVAFIPVPFGGTSITQWQAGLFQDHGTLFGQMVARISQARSGGLAGVLWWQGETDAQNSMSQSNYFYYYTNFTAALATNISAKVMPVKLQACTGCPTLSAVNAAIVQAWTQDPNSAQGPDFSDITPDDQFHLKTDANLATAAARWWTNLNHVVYGH